MSSVASDYRELTTAPFEELRRTRRWAQDPAAWVRERARQFIWSTQVKILESIRDYRKTAVASCHGPGKSFTVAQAVAWWVDSHPIGKAAAVTTAPTDSQVKAILWKEIRRTHARAKLAGRTNQKQWLIPYLGEEEIIAQGRKPNDYDAEAFQGIHARWVLVALDEACGIPGKSEDKPQSLWDAADSLLANDECRMIAIGNPDDPTSEFERVCRPGSGWNVIWISAFDTPNFTGEPVPEWLTHELVGHTWVEEKRKELAQDWQWNEDHTLCVPPPDKNLEDVHPLWVSKVLGRFPKRGQKNGLIPIPWVEQAMDRQVDPDSPCELGVDIAAGGDASATALRRGQHIRIISEDHNPDTMETTGKIIIEMHEYRANPVKVDLGSMGKGVFDRGVELGYPFVGINFGGEPRDKERFINFRAEMYWGLRERFEAGTIDIDPEDRQLIKELTDVRFKVTSSGKVQIEAKDEMKRRLGRSPDRADAVALAFCVPIEPEKKPKGGVLF